MPSSRELTRRVEDFFQTIDSDEWDKNCFKNHTEAVLDTKSGGNELEMYLIVK